VGAVKLKSGKEVPASLVVVGAGAKPNVDLFKGQLELLDTRPGGIKVTPGCIKANPG
jgi:monodehydroascorbate reductase (NADH)